MDFAEKVAVVTGGSRGIGRAIALRLAAGGAKVVVNYHSDATSAGEVVAQIRDAGGEAEAVQAVVRDAYAQLDVLLEQIDEDKMVEPHYVYDDWTIKDILVHLTTWSNWRAAGSRP